jgi:TatD DNase family protein
VTLLPLDLHAHIAPKIEAHELTALRAVVFAATRSLDEAHEALQRRDDYCVWGVGCHPKLVSAQRGFEQRRFAELVERTAFVSEVGLDGSSRVPMGDQQRTLAAILDRLAVNPRIVSLHSYSATAEVVEVLRRNPVPGVVLHWWLGTERETIEALELGCWFSVNASSVRRQDVMATIPLDRLLSETDHPYGDRRNRDQARPGNVADVEKAIGVRHGLGREETRAALWENFSRLTTAAGCSRLLPRAIQRHLIAR